jgi:hypothetical protein
MKVKLLTTISVLTYQLSISQTEKVLHGKVVSQNNVLKEVEVINKTSKTSTTTNDLGEFSILVKAKDSLLFFTKDFFFTRLKVTQENMDQNNIIVNMILKPEELNEVVVTTIKLAPIRLSQQDIDEIKLSKSSSSLQKYTGVYDGTIVNGVDFVRLGTGLLNLFKKEKEEPKKKIPEIDFKKLVSTSIPLDFFTKDLKLKPEEKDLFLEFCDADPKSKTLLQHSNILATMDFLTLKNDAFRKLKTEPKN